MDMPFSRTLATSTIAVAVFGLSALLAAPPVVGQSSDATAMAQVSEPETETDVLEEMGAQLQRIQFYEGRRVTPLTNERRYRTTFDATRTYRIGTELTFSFDAPGETRSFTVDCTYARAGADPFPPIAIQFTVQPEWESVRHAQSLGWSEPGRWPVGDYTVECSSAGRSVATGSFTVEEGPATIEAIGGKLREIRFYETPSGALAGDEREYTTSFPRPDTRFIRVELEIVAPELEEAASFVSTCVFIRDNGTVLGSTGIGFNLEAGWKGGIASHGLGWAEPGNWATGRYRVACTVDGKLLGDAVFTITE